MVRIVPILLSRAAPSALSNSADVIGAVLVLVVAATRSTAAAMVAVMPFVLSSLQLVLLSPKGSKGPNNHVLGLRIVVV